jgi:hypothetical protein
MVRGPRRGGAIAEGGQPDPRSSRRAERKVEKMAGRTHSVAPGPSILEMLEEALTEACFQYRILRAADIEADDTGHRSRRTLEAQGRIRGLAISLAMMRYPLRRYETAWWGYVKKLEKRHLGLVTSRMHERDEAD